MGKPDDRVAVITGGSSGIGPATDRRSVAEGAYVFITGRRQTEPDKAKALIGKNVTAVQGDVANLNDPDRLQETVKRKKGVLHVVVADAGITELASPSTAAPEHYDKNHNQDWFETFELNVMSAVRVSRALAPKMAERGWGRILNISSESGVQPDPVAIEYAAAKGALNALTKALHKAYGGRGVLVNVVSPAYIDTPIVRSVLSRMPGGDKIAPTGWPNSTSVISDRTS